MELIYMYDVCTRKYVPYLSELRFQIAAGLYRWSDGMTLVPIRASRWFLRCFSDTVLSQRGIISRYVIVA